MDPERLGQLLDRHAGPLELFAAQWVRQPEDPVQEAFIELARLPEAPDNPAAWLYTVTRNRAISAARSASRRARHEARAATVADRLVESPDSRLDAQTAAEALEELDDRDREIVVTRLWGGLSFDEIADVIDLSKSSVHRRYEAALRQLRERLGLTWLNHTAPNHGPRTTSSNPC